VKFSTPFGFWPLFFFGKPLNSSVLFKLKKIAVALGLLFGTSACSNIFYYPSKEIFVPPPEHAVPHEQRDFNVTLAKGEKSTKIVTWFFKAKPHKDCAKTLIIYLHGNAENISTHMYQMVWVKDLGIDLLAIDYPGYGLSEGKPTRENVQRSVVQVIDEVLASPEFKDYHVVLYGQSLGGIILLGAIPELKTLNKVNHIVIEASFASYQRLGRRKLASVWLFWPFQWLPYLIVSDKYSVGDDYHKLKLPPITVIHGEEDRVVPFIEGKELFEKLPDPKEFWNVPLADHLQALHPATGIRERLKPKFCSY
jgi:pimeloyl-ACP methyl ester carboxylesterase